MPLEIESQVALAKQYYEELVHLRDEGVRVVDHNQLISLSHRFR